MLLKKLFAVTAAILVIAGAACSRQERQAATSVTPTESIIDGDDHWHNRAVVAMSQGRCEDSLAILNSREASPRADIWSEDLIMANLACYFAGRGESFRDAARSVVVQATAKYPDSSVLAQTRGQVEEIVGNKALALEWYERGKQVAQANLASHPDGPNAHRDRVVLEQSDAAIAEVKRSAG
jgi:hypothetical protein